MPAGNDTAAVRFDGRLFLSRKRLWWAIASFAVLPFALVGVIIFEAMTGRISGTVVQVRIDECSQRKLIMTGFCRPGSTYQLRRDDVLKDSIELRPPTMTAPLLASLRAYLWDQPFSPLPTVADFDRPGSVVYYVKTGDVISLRLDETATLVSLESGRTAQRWAIVTHANE